MITATLTRRHDIQGSPIVLQVYDEKRELTMGGPWGGDNVFTKPNGTVSAEMVSSLIRCCERRAAGFTNVRPE